MKLCKSNKDYVLHLTCSYQCVGLSLVTLFVSSIFQSCQTHLLLNCDHTAPRVWANHSDSCSLKLNLVLSLSVKVSCSSPPHLHLFLISSHWNLPVVYTETARFCSVDRYSYCTLCNQRRCTETYCTLVGMGVFEEQLMSRGGDLRRRARSHLSSQHERRQTLLKKHAAITSSKGNGCQFEWSVTAGCFMIITLAPM